jgi:hypothetical protein
MGGLARTSPRASVPEPCSQRKLVPGGQLLVIAHAILARGTTFTDLGANSFDESHREQVR